MNDQRYQSTVVHRLVLCDNSINHRNNTKSIKNYCFYAKPKNAYSFEKDVLIRIVLDHFEKSLTELVGFFFAYAWDIEHIGKR